MTRILVIEDSDFMREALAAHLIDWQKRDEKKRLQGFELVATGQEGLEKIRSGLFDIILCDLKLPQKSGLDILKELTLAERSRMVFIMMTAFASVETAVEAMKGGAFDYLTKPFHGPDLEAVLLRAWTQLDLKRENEGLREALKDQEEPLIMGTSLVMKNLFALLEKMAQGTGAVLIQGESGVGKEVVARTLHRLSPRRNKPFLGINCAALSSGVLESELFGHERGAFTGADRTRKGRFELADGGILLLDEITEIPIDLQAKLLRILQEQTFERVGSNVTRRVDVRVIATTNRSIDKALREGSLREDLYYRLNVYAITVPPLRDHAEDIPTLVQHFVERFSHKMGGQKQYYAPEALRLLQSHPWPGNVRELVNFVERNFVLINKELLDDKDINLPKLREPRWNISLPLSSEISSPPFHVPLGHSSFPLSPESEGLDLSSSPASFPTLPLEDPSSPGFLFSSGPDSFVGKSMEDIEKWVIEKNLHYYKGNKSKVAQVLGIAERTLRDKIKKWREKEKVTG